MEKEAKPWILFGDLSEVVTKAEKWGGRSIWRKHLYLEQFIQRMEGFDLDYSSGCSTWHNNHSNQTFIRERLDCVVAFDEWMTLNSKTTVNI